MKQLLITTALVLSVAGTAFAGDTNDIDGSLNTNNNNTSGAVTNSHNDSSNTIVNGDTFTGTVVDNGGNKANGYVSNPNLTTSGADTCLGSSSGGISAAGIGISGGKTVVDANCVMIKNAKLLQALGLKDAAVALLINTNPDIAKAMAQAYPQIVMQLQGVQNGTIIDNDRITSGGLY